MHVYFVIVKDSRKFEFTRMHKYCRKDGNKKWLQQLLVHLNHSKVENQARKFAQPSPLAILVPDGKQDCFDLKGIFCIQNNGLVFHLGLPPRADGSPLNVECSHLITFIDLASQKQTRYKFSTMSQFNLIHHVRILKYTSTKVWPLE